MSGSLVFTPLTWSFFIVMGFATVMHLVWRPSMVYTPAGDFRSLGLDTSRGESPLAAPALLILVAVGSYLAVATAFYAV